MTPHSLSASRQVRASFFSFSKVACVSSSSPRYPHNARDSACPRFTDYKPALLQLPPSTALRDSLLAKLAAEIDAQPETLPSIARIGNATQIKNANAPRLARTLTGHSHDVYCVGLCVDGERVVSGSGDKTARVWSATTGQLLQTFTKHSGAVVCVALFSDGTRAVSGGDNDDKTVRIWRLDDAMEMRAFTGHGHRHRHIDIAAILSRIVSKHRVNHRMLP